MAAGKEEIILAMNSKHYHWSIVPRKLLFPEKGIILDFIMGITYSLCYQLALGKEPIIRKRDDRYLYITTFSLALLISWAQAVTTNTNRKRHHFVLT